MSDAAKTIASRRTVTKSLGAAMVAATIGTQAGVRTAQAYDDPGTTPWIGAMRVNLDPVLPASFTTPQFTPYTTTTAIPSLKGATLVSFWLAPGAIRIAHWHPNCYEFPLLLSGEVIVGLMDGSGNASALHAKPGDAIIIPPGYWHWFWNPGSEPMHIINGFTTEAIQQVNMGRWYSSVPGDVFAQSIGITEEAMPHIPRLDNLSFLHGDVDETKYEDLVEDGKIGDVLFSANLFESPKLIDTAAGAVRMIGRDQLPEAGATWRWVSMNPGAVFEPHWHVNAHEMIYVTAGAVEIGIDAPDGNADRFTAKTGDAIYIPQGWGHWVRSHGSVAADLAVFQTAGSVSVSTLKQTLRAMPAEFVARSLQFAPDALDGLTISDGPVLMPPVE